MQGLIYLFIAVVGAAIGVAAYFGLFFSPIEAGLAALIGVAFALVILERTLRMRAEARLQRSVQDLSRLLSTDAQAGQALNSRLNQLEDIEPDRRLEVLEADISVLGTVVRQLAEAVADLEEASARSGKNPSDSAAVETDEKPGPPAPDEDEPVIPLEMLRQALDEDRLTHHVQPIVTLPQRRTHGYDLLPRLMLEDGELADSADFWPRTGGEDLVRQIELSALSEAIAIARRARTAGQPSKFYLPLSAPTLTDETAFARLQSLLHTNEVICDLLCFRIAETAWATLLDAHEAKIEAIAQSKAGFSLNWVRSLRLNYTNLADMGVSSVRVDARRFIDNPASYTDFHTADIAAYVNRFEVELIVTNVTSEPQILTLLDDGIGLVQGPHISDPGPIRPDLMLRGDTRTQTQAAGR